MNKFSDLKKGQYIYCLHLNDNINYDGNFHNFIEKELNVKVDKIKIHQVIYPGIIETGPYHYMKMDTHENRTTYGLREDDSYVNIIYQNNDRLVKLILKNEQFSKNHTLTMINMHDGIFFISKKTLDKYVLDYCNKYIHQYEMQIKDLQEKQEKYQNFVNAYRS